MKSFSPEQNTELAKPLNPAFVKQRRQAGLELSYIEGWHAIAEANRLFGFDGWTRETLDMRPLSDPREVGGKWHVFYGARVRITVLGDVVREGCGFGSGIDRDLGRAHESGMKEAETDAMKRALMTFGNQFGLALYDKQQRGVGVEEPEPELGPITAAVETPTPPPHAAIHVNAEPELGSISVNGEQVRMSAYAARKGGLWEPLVTSLRACKTKAELDAWRAQHAAEFETLPAGWVEELRTEWKDQACEIRSGERSYD